MARGWESKSVEDQIAEKESQAKTAKARQSPEEVLRRNKREGLLMARTRTLTAMETVKDGPHRALYERTLAHLDAELAALEFPL